MPYAVHMFSRLSYGSLLLGLLGSIYLLPKVLSALAPQFDALGGLSFVGPVLLFAFAIPLLLIWLAASRRKNWARIVLALLFVVGLIQTFYDPSGLKIGGLPSYILFAIQTALQGAGLAFVFSPGAKEWFAKTASTATAK